MSGKGKRRRLRLLRLSYYQVFIDELAAWEKMRLCYFLEQREVEEAARLLTDDQKEELAAAEERTWRACPDSIFGNSWLKP